MTGRVCRRSAQRTTSAPPISLVFPTMSLSVTPRDSRSFLEDQRKGYQTINLYTLNTCACPLAFSCYGKDFVAWLYLVVTLEMNGLSSLQSIRVAAVPEEAMAKAMSPRAPISARIRLIKKVLPVPPGASRKMIPLCCFVILSIIVWYPFLWS
ncbi:hypothetical protein AVEN_249088-1 [Araneus ventricosus]|uniref:Uncharacterized protein n=1 Tax=Araneus ventricosus TaxID=182803 RepID=A0A4Y2P960_ARAVE|nr:hypothetical protein AVEN_249088-1 [Araneus ventricosus]